MNTTDPIPEFSHSSEVEDPVDAAALGMEITPQPIVQPTAAPVGKTRTSKKNSPDPPPSAGPPPGWYDDPSPKGKSRKRWWDGTAWTDHRQ
jgi:hypothetical protein